MSRRTALFALAACWTVLQTPVAQAKPLFSTPLFAAHPHPRPPSLAFAYRGFRVDASQAARAQSADKTIKAVKAQIDMVYGVGLKPEILTVMRASPILADAAPAHDADQYGAGHTVTLRVKRLDPKKPVLLRGLLVAYMDQRLPGGLSNPDVERFRQAAIAKHVWPKTAVMLQSDADFFAENATAYLYGAITREPYTRANLRKLEPQLDRWLAMLFDDGRARV